MGMDTRGEVQLRDVLRHQDMYRFKNIEGNVGMQVQLRCCLVWYQSAAANETG